MTSTRAHAPGTGAQAPGTGATGLAAAVAAFGWWGGVPIYFKMVESVPAVELVSHRVAWSVLLMAVVITVLGKWGAVRRVFSSPKVVLRLLGAVAFVSVNWFLFIWAVAEDHVLETSLGYYINPLIMVILGILFLGERLRPWQWAAVALAGVGVLNQAIAVGVFPWVSLTLATTFGFYALIRKTVEADAATGLFVETLLLFPLALGYLVYLHTTGAGTFGTRGLAFDGLIAFTGIATALPLLLFAVAARRLRLSTVGVLQYIAPTGHFFLAVYVFAEPFSASHLVTFAAIWSAVLLYTWDGFRAMKDKKPKDTSLSNEPSLNP